MFGASRKGHRLIGGGGRGLEKEKQKEPEINIIFSYSIWHVLPPPSEKNKYRLSEEKEYIENTWSLRDVEKYSSATGFDILGRGFQLLVLLS